MDPRSMLPAARPATNILSHWYSLYETGQFSSKDFYDSIEEELSKRQVPRLKSSRPEFHEGGVASDKRVYLRLERERYAFEVCAAPFGTGYFFSLRLVEKPRSIGAFALILLLGFVALLFLGARYSLLQILIGGAVLVGIGAFIAWVRREIFDDPNEKAKARTPSDLDSFILNSAVIGPLYERVRYDTYYRYDTRLLFQTLIPEIVKRKVDEVTSRDGVTLLDAYEYSPLLGEAYRAVRLKKAGDDR